MLCEKKDPYRLGVELAAEPKPDAAVNADGRDISERGSVTGWKDGGWKKDGRMEEWKNGRMVDMKMVVVVGGRG